MTANLLSLIPLFLIAFWLAGRHVAVRNLLLLAAGYLVVAWGHPGWLLLLVVLTLIDYVILSRVYPVPKLKKAGLAAGLVINIGAWLCFKYAGSLWGWLGMNLPASAAIPLGLSFYMLRKVSYLLEAYHGRLPASHNVLDYALYVAFLPQLVSGPIEKPQRLLPQISHASRWDWGLVSRALPMLVMGLLKKMVIADNLNMIVTRIFNLDLPSRLLLAAGSLGYAFQLYADFSGYTDLSRALALLLGFETSENFNSPYAALTPQDFWNRWHITFSVFLRDYIFFPLRRFLLSTQWGSRVFLAGFLPPMLAMLASGIWHGTGWTFLLWGSFHGLLIVGYQVLHVDRALQGARLPSRVIAWSIMFSLIVFGWGLFRASSLPWFIHTMLDGPWGASGNLLIAFLSVMAMIVAFCIPLLLRRLLKATGRLKRILMPAYLAAAVVLLIIFAGSGLQDFVYAGF